MEALEKYSLFGFRRVLFAQESQVDPIMGFCIGFAHLHFAAISIARCMTECKYEISNKEMGNYAISRTSEKIILSPGQLSETLGLAKQYVHVYIDKKHTRELQETH